MSLLSLTIDRAELSRPALTITGQRPAGDGFWISTLEEPAKAYRYTYAPDSAHIAGKQLLAAVLEQSAIPTVIGARASNQLVLAALKTELEDALAQWSYQVTLTVGEDIERFSADPTVPQWGAFRAGLAMTHRALAAVIIPVNPSRSS